MVSNAQNERLTQVGASSSDHSAQTAPNDQSTGTLVTARLPADEFALGETLEALPDLQVTCASIGASGKESVFPLVWFQTTAPDSLETALAGDSSVASAEALVHADDRHLYRIEWDSSLRWLCQLLLTSQAICLDARASEADWHVEILYPTREALQETDTFCEQYELSFAIKAVRTIDPAQNTQCGLTTAQYEAITVACQMGYFAVPREASLEDVADEIGVSYQALSERIRRGHETLISAVLGGYSDASVGEQLVVGL